MLFIGEAAELLDQFDFLRIIGVVAGSVEVVEPFGEIHVLDIAELVIMPSVFPRLIGLIFSRNEAPVIAADLFQIEQGEEAENVIMKDSSEPFGIDDRSAFFLQALDDTHVGVVVTVEMIGDQVGVFKDDLFDFCVRIFFAGIQKLVAHEETGCQRLGRLTGADGIKHSLENGRRNRSAVTGARLVVYVPNANSRVILICCNELADHFEIIVAFLGIVEIEVGCYGLESGMLRAFFTSVIAPCIGLFTDEGLLPEFVFRRHTVVCKNDHARDSIFFAERKITVEAFHESVVLFLPDDVFGNQTYRVEARFLHESQFGFRGLEAFFKAELLPLVDSVGAICTHVVASAQPGTRIVPFPDFFFTPSHC